ncbi:MAG: hypothetical protein ABIR18_04005 [Chitinophagaceae bacterium]
MKKILSASFLLFFACSCNNNDSAPDTSESDINAATNFIRSALDGKFNEAKQYMLQDSSNIQYMDVAERNYERAPAETITSYKESSITIYKVDPLNDSTTVVVYFNSFKKDHDTLKVLKVNERWLVDLKYLYLHDMDSTRMSKPNTDTIK